MPVTSKIRVLVLVFALALPGLLVAQTATTGTVLGTVTDPTGAVVSGAQVELKDQATGASRTIRSNEAGQYIFTAVRPGTYTVTVTAEGFRQSVVTVQVEVAKSSLVDVTLALGAVAEVVEVTAGARAVLQTVDATVGDVVDSTSLVTLPTVTRRAIELAFLQVGAQPWTGWAGNGASGVVAGSRPDQNTYLLDGLDISDSQVGGTCCGNKGMGIPVPVESIAEFRSSVTNQNASFGRSTGGQFSLASRRGSNELHGAGYWYHQNDNIAANSWLRNRLGQREPELKDNRYGFRVGGPFLKDKFFFFVNMERRRFPQKTDVAGPVPSASLRSGILRFRDNTGNIVSYDLATSTLCGPTNSDPCDPRGLGMSSVVAAQFGLIPTGNDPTGGDALNTILLRGPTASDQKNDNVLARADYNLSDRWQINFTWAWAQNRFLAPNLNPGIDWRGGAGDIRTISSIPNDPYHYNFAITGQITPRVTNEFRFGKNQSTIEFSMQDPAPLVPGAGVALNLAGGLIEEPYQYQGSRRQLGISRTWQFVDNLTIVKGKHTFQTGVNYQHLWFFHSRAGAAPLHLKPIAQVGLFDFATPLATSRPPTCTTAGQANCLQPGDVTRWNILYQTLLGMVDSVGFFVVRDQQGRPLPGGPDLINDGTWEHLELYFSDTWRLTNSLTLSLGVNGLVELPYSDSEGRRHFLIRMDTGEPLSVNKYLEERAAAARLGRGLNPGLAYSPIQFHPGRREFPVHRSLAPRVAVAWNPALQSGILGRIFGNRRTVFRGGYGLAFHRPMAVGFVQFPQIGNSAIGTPHLLNRPACNFNGTPGTGCNPASTDPALSTLRVGPDGPAPTPPVTPQIPVPFAPAIPFGNPSRLHWDPDYKFGYVHSGDLTIQREVPGNMLVEVGWIGRFGRRLEISKNINAVPFFIADLSGLSPQTFAQAYDAVAIQLRSGVGPGAVTPQPWFENSFGGATTCALDPACTAAGNWTARFATTNTGDFTNGFVNNLWLNALDPTLVALFGEAASINNRQIRFTISHTHGGYNNYHALFVNVNKRPSHGASFTVNYTLSKNLDTLGAIADSAGGMSMNPYDLRFAYGPSLSDRRHGINAYGLYELPFGRGRAYNLTGWGDRIISGWYVSSVITYFSGRALFVTMGGQPFGSPIAQESVPVIRDPQASSKRNLGVAGSGGVGTAGNPATGGSGQNLFTDPEFVFKSFRPFLISQDERSSRGVIRGLPRLTWDFSFGKRTAVTERVSVAFSFDFLNFLNHPLFNDPPLDLLNPATFGVIGSQPGDPGNGDFWSPRQVQFGFRIEF